MTSPTKTLRIAHVGICGSDIQRLDMGQSLLSLGHEVVATDSAAYYAVNPLLTCGECDYCRAGVTRFCAALTSLGKNGHGGFAGGDVHMPLQNLVPIESNDEAYVLADPVACIIHALSLVDITPGQKVLVIGDGSMALISAQLLIERSIISVVQAVKNEGRYQRAHELANVISFDMIEPDTYDTVIVCVGGTRATVLNTAAQAARAGGDVLVVGAYHYLEDALDIKSLLKKEVTLQGSFSFEPRDFSAAVVLISRHIDFFRAMTRSTFDSTQLDEAIQYHRSSDQRHKVVVSYDVN